MSTANGVRCVCGEPVTSRFCGACGVEIKDDLAMAVQFLRKAAQREMRGGESRLETARKIVGEDDPKYIDKLGNIDESALADHPGAASYHRSGLRRCARAGQIERWAMAIEELRARSK